MTTTDECIFCNIMNGKGEARRVFENDKVLCILDIGQLTLDNGNFIPGRCLAIPKSHVTWFYELEDEEAGQLFIAAKNLATKIKHAFNPDFVVTLIRGQRVPHAHIILQPSINGDAFDEMFQGFGSYFKMASGQLLDEMAKSLQQA